MAYADVIGKIYLASFITNLHLDQMWMGLCRDLSPQRTSGDGVVRPRVSGSPTYGTLDLTKQIGTTPGDMEWPDPHVMDLVAATTSINTGRTFRELVNYVAIDEVPGDVAAQIASETAIGLQKEINDSIRGVANAASGVSLLTPLSVATGDWGNDAHQDAVLKKIRDARTAISVQGRPAPRMSVAPGDRQGGLPRLTCVVSSEMSQVIQEGMERKNYFNQPLNEEVLREGVVTRYAGVDIVEDNSQGAGTAAGDNDRHTMFFLWRGESLSYIGGLRMARTLPDSPSHLGVEFRGVYTWGSSIEDPRKLRIAKQTITA